MPALPLFLFLRGCSIVSLGPEQSFLQLRLEVHSNSNATELGGVPIHVCAAGREGTTPLAEMPQKGIAPRQQQLPEIGNLQKRKKEQKEKHYNTVSLDIYTFITK